MKEWYLIGNNTRPNMIGGYEDEGFLDWKDDSFFEALSTEMASDLILYSHDLSVGKEIRGIVQGNVADTQLKSMERTVLVPIDTLRGGDYILFEDNYWIVDGLPGNNKIYEKATIKICQYKFRWQKDDSTIIERWGNMTSASKYDVGEGGNNTIILSSNNYTILIPHDDDGQTIEGKRVFIDTSKNPHKVFKITRNDDPLFLYGVRGGVLSLIADKTEFNKDTDRPDLLLCDYIDTSSTTPPVNETSVLLATISGNPEIKFGYSRKYTVTFTDKNTWEPVDWNEVQFSWHIDDNYSVEQTVSENKIELSVTDELMFGTSFVLQCIVDEDVVGQIEICVTEGW